MKGFIAMQKMDLISDEYVREAEIDMDTPVMISEKGRFWKEFARFMNSPVGVAMLCAVVSLSVLAAIVIAGTGDWEEWFPPAGSRQESESVENNYESIPPLPAGTEFKVTRTKDHVAEFYQALIDQGMMGMIPSYDKDGELVTTDSPDYFFEEEDIYNVTPAEVYEQTGAMIFDAGWLIYLWHDGDIHILSTRLGFGASFYSAVPCDYDLNGTPDILYTYAFHMSGVWGYTTIGVYDTVADQVIPLTGDQGHYVVADCPAVIDETVLADTPSYLIYVAEVISTSQAEEILNSTELVYVLHPSSQGLMLMRPNLDHELVVPIPAITDIPELVPTALSQYLDKYGFAGGLSEGDFIHGALGKFSYEGQPLNEMPIVSGSGELPDGGFTGTALYQGDCRDFDFSHSSKFPADNNDSYAYYLRTQVPLDGFALPHGMVLGDTFDQALVKMALEDLPPFTPGATVLYRAGGETLTVIREDADTALSYRLVFEETETSTVSEERDVTVTRKLTLSFGQDLKLFEVKIAVDTQYSTFTVQVTDIPELTPAVATEIKQAFFEQNVTEADQAFYSIDDLSIRYYGSYNGGHAMFVDGIFDYTTAFQYETVLGIEFEYGSGQKLLYYKDGRFYSLPEAVEAGHLNQADLNRLHAAYTQ